MIRSKKTVIDGITFDSKTGVETESEKGANKMLSKLAIGAGLCGAAVATIAAGVLIYATLPIEMFMIFVGFMLAIAGWLSWLFIGGF